ncbi:hypothetical protein INT47_011790 [Mucor saturninus]|uniref:Uncharacterized protein n=1 Tax=Mucor saturninus TaxID=64648 RepID=A0A8H7RBX9_9FUNG|nr:hypothetical protein INT47_011790 [Mucor saturninus]
MLTDASILSKSEVYSDTCVNIEFNDRSLRSVHYKMEKSANRDKFIHCNNYLFELPSKFLTWCINLPTQYQQHIMDLEMQGYYIVGYCRKSRTTTKDNSIITCLQYMVLRIGIFGFIMEKVPLLGLQGIEAEKQNAIMEELAGISGTAQGV